MEPYQGYTNVEQVELWHGMHSRLWIYSQIAKFMGPTWDPPGSCRLQMGPMLVPWTLLSFSQIGPTHRGTFLYYTIYDDDSIFTSGDRPFCINVKHTHIRLVMHICVRNLTIIGSDNGLSPGRRQGIIRINRGILLIWPLGTYFSEILIDIQTFSFTKMYLKMSSAKWQSCFGP